MSNNVGWSEDRVSILQKLWLDGLSAAQVAKQLGGVTRNAVIGKVHRIGLADRGLPQGPRVKRVSAPRPPRPARQTMPVRQSRPAAIARPAPVVVTEGPGLVTDLAKLGVHACKWPIGDPQSASFSFCGAHTEGRYCVGHESLGTRPGKKPRPIDCDPVVRRALAGLI